MLKVFFRTVFIVVLATQSFGATGNDSAYFAARRQLLMKKIEGSVAALQGAVDTRAYEAFRQNNDFYYLTGVATPGAFLLVDAVEKHTILFLPPRNQHMELWEGPRLHAGEDARVSTGCDEVLDVGKFESEMQKRRGHWKSLYTPLKAEEIAATSRDRATQFDMSRELNPWDGRVSRARAFEQNLRKKLGESVSIKDLSPILDDLRRVKDAQEIGRLREAGRIGAIGMKEAIRGTKPGLYEYQIAALANFYFVWNGAMGPSYFPVVGSGPNSCILHYHVNTRRAEAGDIVVMDFGPDYAYYQSDITRSFPVSGTFTPEQAKLYQIVLEAQKAGLRAIRPGATFRALNEAVDEVILKAGLGQYRKHGISHHVGMSVHDVGNAETLKSGVVITMEPGLYVPEKHLGIRIEDTVLVTKDGFEVLTGDVPKEIRDIELLMADKSVSFPK